MIEDIENFMAKLPMTKSVDIVKIDASGLVALNKPAGILSHPNPKNATGKQSRALFDCPYNFKDECYSYKTKEGEKLKLYLVNRLDSHTSGLILVATNSDVATQAKLAFKNHKVQKEYLAICLGRPLAKKGVFRDFIKTTNSSNKFVRSNIENANKNFNAECYYSLLKGDINNLNLSLLSLKPTTGKTHQLRIQCANKRLPILGDATYGNFMRNKDIKRKTKVDRLCLHCKNISLQLHLDDKKINFEASAQMPQSFTKLIEKSI
ncbi:MAG: RluA family pseudouridine synthase [Opitutales bacterium]